MLSTLRNIGNIWRIPDLRNKVLFTFAMVIIYRIGAFIPSPGINFDAVAAIRARTELEGGGVLDFLALFSGGALTQMAIFALGVFPYITASIIMQILGIVIPRIEQWQNQGAVGQRKITQWTRYMTIAIAIVQSTGFAFLFNRQGSGFGTGSSGQAGNGLDLLPTFTPPRVGLVVLTLTAGTALLMWMGELITQKGVGNGISIIIFASVMTTIPNQFVDVYNNGGWGWIAGILVLYIIMLVAIVFVENGQRRIPVTFSKRVVGRRQYGGTSTFIPLKVNQSGVIPIIFASSVLYLPQLVAVVLPAGWGDTVRDWVDRRLVNPADPVYLIIFGLLIVGFAYFYTAITFDPVKKADELRRQGGHIAPMRPGYETERHLAKILSRITFPGALFIAVVALLPAVALGLVLPAGSTGFFGFSGISILIAVGVGLETMKQIDSQLMMRNYEGFLK
ncbi:MAG: preprotein translocase subunit SecY [Actinomycetota bacterium]